MRVAIPNGDRLLGPGSLQVAGNGLSNGFQSISIWTSYYEDVCKVRTKYSSRVLTTWRLTSCLLQAELASPFWILKFFKSVWLISFQKNLFPPTTGSLYCTGSHKAVQKARVLFEASFDYRIDLVLK